MKSLGRLCEIGEQWTRPFLVVTIKYRTPYN